MAGVEATSKLIDARLAKRRASRLPVVSGDLRRRILDVQPFFLDGALAAPGAASLLRQTRRLLMESPAPAARLDGRGLAETLAGIRGVSKSTTRAGLVPVGPRRMRVWWDENAIPGALDVLADLSRPKMVMRFYDVTGLPPGAQSWNHIFDIEVGLREGARTVDFWSADRVYLVDLGVVYADGRFMPMARTNSAALPRESRGMPGDATARSALPGKARLDLIWPKATAEALAWFDRGGDWPLRDMEAETLLYTLYRAFLEEGPRALTRVPPLAPRDRGELEREYRARGRMRGTRAKTRAMEKRPAIVEPFVIARLDGAPAMAAGPLTHLPVPAMKRSVADLPGDLFGHYRGVFLAAVGGVEPRFTRKSVPGVITPIAEKIARPFADRAASIHETAASLRRAFSSVPPSSTDRPAPVRTPVTRVRVGDAYDVGGAEGRRLAKSGVQFDRLTVMFEGHAEPGARLRVGGRLVVADASGRFSVECVLNGRKLRIPVEAEAAGRVRRQGALRVEWENSGKSARKRKKALTR